MAKPACAILAALCLAQPFWAGPLWADITPQDVWLNWQVTAQSQGATLTAEKTADSGDTLTLSGLVLTFGAAAASVRLDTLALTETGDGGVAVELPDSFPLRLTLPDGPQTQTPTPTLTLTVSAPQARITASGNPNSIGYDKHLPRLTVTGTSGAGADKTDLSLKASEVTATYRAEAAETGQTLTGSFAAQSLNLTVAANEGGKDTTDLALSLSDLKGKLDLTGLPTQSDIPLETALDSGMTFDAALTYGIGALDLTGIVAGDPFKLAATLGGGNMGLALDAAKFHYDLNTKAISLNLAGTDPTSRTPYSFVGAVADLGNSLDINGRGWAKSGDFAAALRSGLVMAGGASLGSTHLDFAGGPAYQPVKVKASLAEASTAFTLAAAQMTYDLGTKALSVTLAAPGMPLPDMAVDLGELALALAMPMAKSDQPAPFAYVTRIVDLTLAPPIWALIDPTGSLPHDPATLIIDTKGSAILAQDLMDQAGDLSTTPPDTLPGVLTALDIPQLRLSALGAEVSAKGGFTFDPTRTEAFDMPEPTGRLDIRATGLNRLIDTLLEMGLLPQDQAMQARMGLSMFARNDMTRDEATSAIEFRDQHLFVNGAQMQ